MWRPPEGSVVHDSARRLDPTRVAGGYALGLALVAVVLLVSVVILHVASRAPDEMRLDTLQRESERAPWVVVTFFVALGLAGTTKRCFGFGRAGVTGLVSGLGASAVLAFTDVPFLAVFGAGAAMAALLFAVTRTRWRFVSPWIAFGLSACAAIGLAGVGISPARWSDAARAATQMGGVAVGACLGAALGLWTLHQVAEAP